MCLMYVYLCMPAFVGAHKAFFLYCVWCSTNNEQHLWRESLLTDSDGKLWNGNKASCHYSTDSLSRTHRCIDERSKTAMITDKRANSVCQLSLADMLNSNCYEIHAWWTENHFWILTKTAATQADGFVEEHFSLNSFFVLFCFRERNPTNKLPRVQYTAYCVHIDTHYHQLLQQSVVQFIVSLKISLLFT